MIRRSRKREKGEVEERKKKPKRKHLLKFMRATCRWSLVVMTRTTQAILAVLLKVVKFDWLITCQNAIVIQSRSYRLLLQVRIIK